VTSFTNIAIQNGHYRGSHRLGEKFGKGHRGTYSSRLTPPGRFFSVVAYPRGERSGGKWRRMGTIHPALFFPSLPLAKVAWIDK